jgi:hypothetical protein
MSNSSTLLHTFAGMYQVNRKHIILLLQLSTAFVFAGRAWQHLFFDAPYRELLWDNTLMKPLIEQLTPLTWHEYVTNLAVDESIQQWMTGLGVFYTICAIIALLIFRIPVFFRYVLWVGAIGLTFLALLYMMGNFYHAGQFFEFTLQFGSPVFLLIALKQSVISPKLRAGMKVAIALTFACHGLYALGYYPRPGYYLEMTMRILGIFQSSATLFLQIAGALDFVVALGVFLPWKWSRWVLGYAVFWGFITAIARIWGNFYWDFPLQSLHEWVYQMVFRIPHTLVPLAVLLAREKIL